jgi:hypothetical protein
MYKDFRRSGIRGRHGFGVLFLLLLPLWCGTEAGARAQDGDETPVIERADPPEADFFAKTINCEGIFIRASASVEDGALLAACMRMKIMLASMDIAKQNLRQRGVELHIVGKEQSLSDLPENQDARASKKSQTTIDKNDADGGRAKAGLYSACGEESLLAAPSPPGENNADFACASSR